MDFPTIVLIVIGVTVVATVMAAGGLKELLPRKAPLRQQPSGPEPAGDEDPGREPEQPSTRPGLQRRGATPGQNQEERDDPADNFFSDEDDYAFREPDYNRGAFSQREEDRDSIEDPDRNR